MGNCLKKKNDFNCKKEYFLYLNRVKSNHFNSILNNISNNNKIALQKKDFEKIRTIKLKQDDTLILNDIYWLSYIKKYFKKKYKEGAIWYKTILDKISEERFLFDMQYQSYAFYRDFEMKYKTKILRNLENEKDKFEDKEEELISKITRNSIVDINRNSKISLSGITDNYGGSFGDFKDDLDSSEEDLGVKAKKKLKIFIRILKRHLNSKNHPINIVITFFCQIFSSVLDQQVEIFSKNKNDPNYKERIKSFSEEITEDLKKFIIKIQTTVKLFYNKSINLDFFVEEKDEVINLVTSIIFLKENIYKNIYSLFYIQFEEEVNDFKYKLNLMKNIKPIDLNIPNKLSLDENTSKEILKLKEEFKKEKEEGLYEYINENDNKIFVPEDGVIKGFHKQNKIEGYNTVIKMLMGLKHAQTPFDKMILIASMSMEITQCVDTYWNNMDDYLPNYYLSINADELLSLFILVVVRAQFPELIIHEKIIQKFTTKTIKSSTIGYYNVTLNAAIEYIQDEGAKEFKSKINFNNGKADKYNSNLISKYIYQNLSKNEINDNNDEFILIDSKGKNIINNNNNNIINTSSKLNKSYNDIQKANTFFNKKKKNILGIEEDEEKNFELSIKNSDDD